MEGIHHQACANNRWWRNLTAVRLRDETGKVNEQHQRCTCIPAAHLWRFCLAPLTGSAPAGGSSATAATASFRKSSNSSP